MFEGMNNKRKGIEIDPMTGLEVPKELEVYEPPYLARVGRRIEGSVRPTTPAHTAQSHERSFSVLISLCLVKTHHESGPAQPCKEKSGRQLCLFV